MGIYHVKMLKLLMFINVRISPNSSSGSQLVLLDNDNEVRGFVCISQSSVIYINTKDVTIHRDAKM